MASIDPRVDEYIEKAQPFAKPILKKLRNLIHKACPEVTETIKWGMPSFEYKGPYCGIASFKQHCVLGFWKSTLIKDPKKYLQDRATRGGDAMGNLGRITTVKDLPPDKVMLDFLKQAKKLNDDGIKVEKKKTKEPKKLVMHPALVAALNKNKIAKQNFNNFSPSNQREYADWINEAKTEVTREKRLETAITWIGEGKPRNWKYLKK